MITFKNKKNWILLLGALSLGAGGFVFQSSTKSFNKTTKSKNLNKGLVNSKFNGLKMTFIKCESERMNVMFTPFIDNCYYDLKEPYSPNIWSDDTPTPLPPTSITQEELDEIKEQIRKRKEKIADFRKRLARTNRFLKKIAETWEGEIDWEDEDDEEEGE